MIPENQTKIWEYVRLLEERIKYLEELTNHLRPK